MRPAVYASVIRNRNKPRKDAPARPHTFSLRRLLLIVFIGGLLFVPGLTLCILGLEQVSDVGEFKPPEKVLYRVIGPAACALGICFLFASCIYYYCYGLNESRPTRVRNPSKSHQGHHSSYSSIRNQEKNTSLNSPTSPDGVRTFDHQHHRRRSGSHSSSTPGTPQNHQNNECMSRHGHHKSHSEHHRPVNNKTENVQPADNEGTTVITITPDGTEHRMLCSRPAEDGTDRGQLQTTNEEC